MGKISDEDGGWLEDEAGHGIYDLAGMTEAIAGAMTFGGAVARRVVQARSSAGADTPTGSSARRTVQARSLTGDI